MKHLSSSRDGLGSESASFLWPSISKASEVALAKWGGPLFEGFWLGRFSSILRDSSIPRWPPSARDAENEP